MIEQFRDLYISDIHNEAEELLGEEMPKLSEDKFSLFETTGDRLKYENDYFGRRKFLTVTGCAVLTLLHDKRPVPGQYINKLEDVIASVCSEECWALPAHVNRNADPDWRVTVDLFAAETAQALAELYSGLEGVLKEELRVRMKEEVSRRVLEPFSAKEPYAWWERSDMNWNAVCNGSIGLTALDMLNDEPELQKGLAERITRNLDYYLDGFTEDGACPEGLGYYTYGFYYYLGFMDALSRKKKQSIKALLPEKVRRIAEFQQKCFFPAGLSLGFSDGSMHEKYRIGLACRLSELFDDVVIPDIKAAAGFGHDPCCRFLMASRDVEWTTA